MNALKIYVQKKPDEFIWLVLLTALFCGAMISKFLISLSIMLLLIHTMIKPQWVEGKVRKIRFVFIDFKSIKSFIKTPAFSILLLIIPAVLISAVLSDDMHYGISRLQLYLPYLALPVIFWSQKPISEGALKVFIIICMTINAMVVSGILINYFLHYEVLTKLIGHGKSLPAPTSHIRLSLFTGFLSLSGFWLVLRQKLDHNRGLKHYTLSLAIILIVGLHVLAVRSGLALFYLSAIVLIVKYIFTRKMSKVTFVFFILLLALPVVSYFTVPSFKTRLDYMQYDLEGFAEGRSGTYSDSDRIKSIICGMEIFRDHVFLGCGIGDVRQEMEQVRLEKYGETSVVRIPHNQYIYILASTGLLGALLIFPALFFPYMRNRGAFRELLFYHGLFFLGSCLVEPTMEGSVGIVFHLLFLLLLLNHSKQ